jgi:hypothetical protein
MTSEGSGCWGRRWGGYPLIGRVHLGDLAYPLERELHMDVFLYVCICILGVERLDWIRKCTLGPSANCGAGAQQMNGGRAGWLRTVPWRDCAIARRGKYLDSRAVAVCLCAK